jgi:hypothetical protein
MVSNKYVKFKKEKNADIMLIKYKNKRKYRFLFLVKRYTTLNKIKLSNTIINE